VCSPRCSRRRSGAGHSADLLCGLRCQPRAPTLSVFTLYFDLVLNSPPYRKAARRALQADGCLELRNPRANLPAVTWHRAVRNRARAACEPLWPIGPHRWQRESTGQSRIWVRSAHRVLTAQKP